MLLKPRNPEAQVNLSPDFCNEDTCKVQSCLYFLLEIILECILDSSQENMPLLHVNKFAKLNDS